MSGGISFPVAQVYHSLYFLGLLIITYFTAKALYSEKEAFYSLLLLATCPMILAFSVIFYLEVPVAMFCILALLFILKARYILAGISLGLVYLAKRNGVFILPGVLLTALFLTKAPFGKKIKNISILISTSFILIIPDLLWRENALNHNLIITSGNEVIATRGIFNRMTLSLSQIWDAWMGSVMLKSSETPVFINPLDIAKYFGLAILISAAFYIIYKKYQKKDLVFWLPIVSFFILFIYFLGPFADIRYILPIIPFLAIPISGGFLSFQKRFSKQVIIGICVIQFCSAIGYVNMKRRMPADTRAAFDFIKKNTPKDAYIFYPGQILLEAAERRVIWSRFGVMPDIFWPKDSVEFKNGIGKMKLDYIAIDKKRIYDDSRIRHFGGYPKSFAERLRIQPFLKLVFENNCMQIYQIEK